MLSVHRTKLQLFMRYVVSAAHLLYMHLHLADLLHGAQVTVPKRSQSSQDMLQLQQRPTRPTTSLASTPEKPEASQPDTSDRQQEALQQEAVLSNARAQKAGGLGLLGRVASGLLGSGSKKGSSDKKVSCMGFCQ